MKKLSILAAVIHLVQFCYAQEIKCRVTDTQGEQIEFVTVAIEGTSYGAISDGSGYFLITIPEALNSSDLIFSHISFMSMAVNVLELKERFAKSENPVTIQLERRDFSIPEVVISARHRKTVTLSGAGIPIGIISYPGCSTFNSIDRTSELWEWRSFGRTFSSNSQVMIQSIDFKARCSADSVMLRVSVYGIDANSMMVPMGIKPVYVMIQKSSSLIHYDIDLGPCEAFGRGSIYIEMSFRQPIDDKIRKHPGIHPIFVEFPIHTGSYQISYNGKVRTISPALGLGIAVRGVKLKD